MISDRQCRILVGGAVIAMEAPDSRLALRLRRHFRVAPPEGDPAVILRLDRAPRGREPIPDSLFADKRVDGASFIIGDGVVRGTVDRAGRAADVRIDERLFEGRGLRIFEQLLYQAFAGCLRAGEGDAFLLHSSGVVRGGAGSLFTGPSGAGKSTVARMCGRHLVLNDEICLVDLRGPVAMAASTPFNGLFRAKGEGRAPLSAVYVLAQAGTHRVSPMGPGEAVAALLPQIVPPIGLDEAVGREAVERMLGLANALAERVPVRRLEFRRDDGFWREIDGEARRVRAQGGSG